MVVKIVLLATGRQGRMCACTHAINAVILTRTLYCPSHNFCWCLLHIPDFSVATGVIPNIGEGSTFTCTLSDCCRFQRVANAEPCSGFDLSITVDTRCVLVVGYKLRCFTQLHWGYVRGAYHIADFILTNYWSMQRLEVASSIVFQTHHIGRICLQVATS